MSLEIIYDGEPEKRDHGIAGFCQMLFHDSEINLVKFRHEKDSSFYMLKSEPGEIVADRLNCMHHIIPLLYLKHRRIDLTYWAYWAHPGHINYLGHVTINYKPAEFGPRDLIALGGLKYDRVGKVDVRVEDRAEEAVSFLAKNYPELKNMPLAKSFLEDISKIKPNSAPEIYSPSPTPVSATTTTTPNPATPSPQNANPYYTPYQAPQGTTYYNPYEHQESTTPTPK